MGLASAGVGWFNRAIASSALARPHRLTDDIETDAEDADFGAHAKAFLDIVQAARVRRRRKGDTQRRDRDRDGDDPAVSIGPVVRVLRGVSVIGDVVLLGVWRACLFVADLPTPL